MKICHVNIWICYLQLSRIHLYPHDSHWSSPFLSFILSEKPGGSGLASPQGCGQSPVAKAFGRTPGARARLVFCIEPQTRKTWLPMFLQIWQRQRNWKKLKTTDSTNWPLYVTIQKASQCVGKGLDSQKRINLKLIGKRFALLCFPN